MAAPGGQAQYTSPGTYSWTCPPGVTSVCAVCVGAAGGSSGFSSHINYAASSGGGGELRWKNNITVVPGNYYTVVVGQGGAGRSRSVNDGGPQDANDGGDSYFVNTSTVRAYGGKGGKFSAPGAGGSGGTGDGGGNGGDGSRREKSGAMQPNLVVAGGAGAGGYSGAGGSAGYGEVLTVSPFTESYPLGGGNGSGGGGGGAAAGNGGGVGLLGQGSNGASSGQTGDDGGPGSGGFGTQYGASGGAYAQHTTNPAMKGGGADGEHGAVRIIWGPGRAFPSTNTGDM